MKLYMISAQIDEGLKDVSLPKTAIQSLADAHKRQAATLPDALKALMPLLYGADSLEGQLFWGLRSTKDIQGLHRLRCLANKKRPHASVTEAALQRLHHCFPTVQSEAQLKCFIVEADPICVHPYFRHAIRSTGSVMTENPRALAPEYWERAYPYVFAFHKGIELVSLQKAHRIIAELNYEQLHELLQYMHKNYGADALDQMTVESLMDCIAHVCHS